MVVVVVPTVDFTVDCVCREACPPDPPNRPHPARAAPRPRAVAACAARDPSDLHDPSDPRLRTPGTPGTPSRVRLCPKSGLIQVSLAGAPSLAVDLLATRSVAWLETTLRAPVHYRPSGRPRRG